MDTAVPPEKDDRQVLGKPPVEKPPIQKPRRRSRRWAYLIPVALILAFGLYVYSMPKSVFVVKPQVTTMAETIASSGIVQGHVESTIGAQVQGIVTNLYVEEGDTVHTGQLLARVQNNVALRQVDQATRALATSRAVLAQASARPLPSEIESARARIRLAEAGISQQTALVSRARAGRRQAGEAVHQSEMRAAQAEAAVHQAESRLDLATKNLDRATTLVKAGAVPQSSADAAQSAHDVAVQDLASTQQALSVARLAITSSQDGLEASGKDIEAAQGQRASTQAQLEGARSDLKSLLGKPRPEDVAVAQQRVIEAEAALATTSTQAKNTDVLAPFDGTVTAVLAEIGSSPTATGILRLVQTGRLEIRLDLDEASLRDVRVGQRAILATPSGQFKDVAGHVSRLGSQIDSQRGTLEVYVVTNQPASWLHPGQTLNVNVVTVEKAQRLLVPTSAIQRQGDQTLVYVLEQGKAKARPVLLGLISDDKITVLDGLTESDRVIANSYQIVEGMRVEGQP